MAIDDQVSLAIKKQINDQKVQNLFRGKRFYLMREIPRDVVCLIVRSCGGECSWDKSVSPGATFPEDDPKIDYQIVDRPMTDLKITRYYVQPQWVFDSLNAGRILPAQDYLPGVSLPPHLSPFTAGSGLNEILVQSSVSQRGGLIGVAPGFGEGANTYRPPEADYFAGLVSLAELRGNAVQAQAEGRAPLEISSLTAYEHDDNHNGQSDDDESMQSEPETHEVKTKKQKENAKLKKSIKGKSLVFLFCLPEFLQTRFLYFALGMDPLITPGRSENKKAQLMQERAEANAERKLREMLLPKKHRNAYKKMVHSIKRKEKEVRQLTEKRRVIDS
ncbi:unnamed protein product [Echinostoma caproni]|uniref:BRCT domain-containing protein n=1 Tax=Echinostoma caproni TaxID=27848 RepID=A0A183B0H9_9TREM|nr:unnamed protein product [Echinostoma caproni]